MFVITRQRAVQDCSDWLQRADDLEDFAEKDGQGGWRVAKIGRVARRRKAGKMQQREGLQGEGCLVQRVADRSHQRGLHGSGIHENQFRLSLEIVHCCRQRAHGLMDRREYQFRSQLVERCFPRCGSQPDVLKREVEEAQLGQADAQTEPLLGVQLAELQNTKF